MLHSVHLCLLFDDNPVTFLLAAVVTFGDLYYDANLPGTLTFSNYPATLIYHEANHLDLDLYYAANHWVTVTYLAYLIETDLGHSLMAAIDMTVDQLKHHSFSSNNLQVAILTYFYEEVAKDLFDPVAPTTPFRTTLSDVAADAIPVVALAAATGIATEIAHDAIDQASTFAIAAAAKSRASRPTQAFVTSTSMTGLWISTFDGVGARDSLCSGLRVYASANGSSRANRASPRRHNRRSAHRRHLFPVALNRAPPD